MGDLSDKSVREHSRRRGFLPTRRSCLIGFVCVITCIGIVVSTIHHVTCMFNAGLCTSVWHNLGLVFSGMMFDTMYEDIDLNAFGPTHSDASCSAENMKLLNSNNGASSKKLVILLTTQKSGSTWVQRRIATHPEIQIIGEALIDFSRECNVAQVPCTWTDYRTKLESVLMKGVHTPSLTKAYGFKLMYDHIPMSMRETFAEWCACNRIVVVHLVRSASVESFWTLQAQVGDMVQLGHYQDRVGAEEEKIAGKLTSNQGLTLDAAHAAEYVITLEKHRELYRRLLRYNMHIRYYELFYEQLTDTDYGARYWAGLQGFLEVNPADMTDTLQRLHPGTCKSKIKNWDEVRKALQGTDCEWACENQHQAVIHDEN